MGARGRVGRCARGAVAASVGATARMVVVGVTGVPRGLGLIKSRAGRGDSRKLDVKGSTHVSEHRALRWARGMMTTVWRPRVRIPVPEVDEEAEVEVKEEANGEDGVKQGAKRKRAPYTKGPCPHGVK